MKQLRTRTANATKPTKPPRRQHVEQAPRLPPEAVLERERRICRHRERVARDLGEIPHIEQETGQGLLFGPMH